MISRDTRVILFNPRSADSKPRIPNSVLQVAASIDSEWDYVIVDGNLEVDPWPKLESLINERPSLFGCTVMPGPQLRQAIPYSRRIKELYPRVPVVWGGYFASNQHQTVLASGTVDYVVDGPGDEAFPRLLDALSGAGDRATIPNLIYSENGRLQRFAKAPLVDQDTLPPLPYERLAQWYPLENYLGRSFLGRRTVAYHSSIGCPFACSFCAVVPIYETKWKGKSAERIYRDIRWLRETYDADAIEFHDNNFFVSRKRVTDFAKLIHDDGMQWWGEARIDTVDKYRDEDLERMRAAGCRMIFFGAETGSDEVLRRMNKGGTQTGDQIKRFAGRLAEFDIIPEYSFVLGSPAESREEVFAQIDADIDFIREVKAINPAAEIIIYVYSPVATEGSELFEGVKAAGFSFPKTLDEWLAPEWIRHDQRKNPMAPWLEPEMVERIQDFETVLHGLYPTVSDVRLRPWQRRVLAALARRRYQARRYQRPRLIRALQGRFKYRQPEVEGFYQE